MAYLRLTPGVEAGVAVVVVGSRGLTDSEGAQHQSSGVEHFEMWSWWSFADAVGYICAAEIVTSFNGGYEYIWLVNE